MLSNRTMVLDTRSAKPAAKAADPFYLTPEWRALVAEIIRERGAKCEDPECRFPNRTGIRLFGDHIVEARGWRRAARQGKHHAPLRVLPYA
jgi:5-methylcytosine-specific restriction protein A